MTAYSSHSRGEFDQEDKHTAAWGALRYTLQRVLAVAITLLIGVFLTVVIANHTGMLDKAIKQDISRRILTLMNQGEFKGETAALRAQMEREAGVSLPFIPKYLRYSVRALELNWGEVRDHRKFFTWLNTPEGTVSTVDSRRIVLTRLPNTLLLSGMAFLLLVFLGIPIALYLSRREGSWLDRVFGVLTPLSSVPSWVIGILLVFIFAVELRLLPVGKMYGDIPPPAGWQTALVVAYHLVLPVSAIVLSLLFQLVYTWRTYFIIYAGEEYVTLAKAVGLRQASVDFHHVLRPALPFLVTNLALTLVGFWQMTAALEYFFQWPGIGSLFMDAQPNFHSEVMYVGEMGLVVDIIVIFAYLLALSVFLLDFLYMVFDPRIRLQSPGRVKLPSFKRDWLHRRRGGKFRASRSVLSAAPRVLPNRRERRSVLSGAGGVFSNAWRRVRRFFNEVWRVPSAMIGLVMTALLLVLALMVMVFMPYDPVARDWSASGFSDAPQTARKALPSWLNWFRARDLPRTIIVNSRDAGAAVSSTDGGDFSQVSYDLSFDYPYSQFPAEVAIYFTTSPSEKLPFISMTWFTPDGRELRLKNTTLPARQYTYPLEKSLGVSRLVAANPGLKDWVVTSGSLATPAYMLLFADPARGEPAVMNGRYTLRVQGMFFEPGGELEAQLVVFGLVEGWAGTDYLRRDLGVPLLWGLPFALLIGVLGAALTNLVSLLLAAVSAWYGGWVDSFIQRVTEANLVLPVMAIGVLLYSYYNLSLWLVIGLIILSNILGSSTKTYRAAFLQEKEAGYIEAARAYGAGSWRIIWRYLVRRILPVIIPQVVMLIPGFIFLEATLAIFNISDPRYPT